MRQILYYNNKILLIQGIDCLKLIYSLDKIFFYIYLSEYSLDRVANVAVISSFIIICSNKLWANATTLSVSYYTFCLSLLSWLITTIQKKKKENPLHITILRNKIIIIIAKYYLRNLYTLKSREIVLGYASFGLNLKIDQIQGTTFAICLYHAQRNIHFANLKSNHSIPCSKSDLICSDLDSW